MRHILLTALLAVSLSASAQQYGDIMPFGCSHVVSNFWPKAPHGVVVFVGRHTSLLCRTGEVYIATFYSVTYRTNVNIQVDYEVWCCAERGDRYTIEW